MPFAAFDTETSGLSPKTGGRIVEIAVVLVDDRGRITGRFESLLNPGGSVGATHIHRISQQDVADAPTFRDIAPKLVELFDRRVLVAHNAPFDVRFITAEFEQVGYTIPALATIDTCQVSRKYRAGASSHKLIEACADYGVVLEDAHRAMADTEATALLWSKMLTTHNDPAWARELTAAANTPWAPLSWEGTGGYRREDIGTRNRTGWQPVAGMDTTAEVEVRAGKQLAWRGRAYSRLRHTDRTRLGAAVRA